jgi:hypothetical protein
VGALVAAWPWRAGLTAAAEASGTLRSSSIHSVELSALKQVYDITEVILANIPEFVAMSAEWVCALACHDRPASDQIGVVAQLSKYRVANRIRGSSRSTG